MNAVFEVLLEDAGSFCVKNYSHNMYVTVDWKDGETERMNINIKNKFIDVTDYRTNDTKFEGDFMAWLNWYYDRRKMNINLKEEN